MPKFTVFARGTDLSKLGTIDGYTELSVTPRFNAVGSWSLTYPVDSLGASLLSAGRGVRIFRRDAPSGTPPVMTGPVTGISETLTTDRKTPQVQFTGACDNIWLAWRLCLPDPATSGNTYVDAYDTRAGVAETIMRQYVNLNAGPGALAARQVLGLALAADLARGPSISYSARFESLLVAMQNLGVASGLGFQVQQAGSQLVFSLYAPKDNTKLVRFSADTKALGGYSYSLTAPSADAVYVGDATPSTGRSFKQYSDAGTIADWGRIEAFVDQSNTNNTTQLDQAGAQALDTGSPQAAVTFDPRDTPQRRFGVDYGLGDKVTVKVRLGTVADVVREVTITDTNSAGVTVRPTVGGSQASDASSASQLYKMFSTLARAVGYLQRGR